MARYTHRVAISNHRLVSFVDGKVTFGWKDYAHGNQQRLMTLTADEFLRRFLLHTLPRGFVRIRFFGFMTHRRRAALLPVCRSRLKANPQAAAPMKDEGGILHRRRRADRGKLYRLFPEEEIVCEPFRNFGNTV